MAMCHACARQQASGSGVRMTEVMPCMIQTDQGHNGPDDMEIVGGQPFSDFVGVCRSLLNLGP